MRTMGSGDNEECTCNAATAAKDDNKDDNVVRDVAAAAVALTIEK